MLSKKVRAPRSSKKRKGTWVDRPKKVIVLGKNLSFIQKGNKGPLPQSQKVTFVYYQYVNLNPGIAGVPSQYVFSANGCYDPNISGGGHQPRGFDQLMALYDHYTVIGTRINVSACNTDTTGSQIIGIYVADNSTSSSSPIDIMERRLLTYTPLASQQAGGACANILYQLNPNEFLGRSKPLSDPELKGSNGGNPAEQAYLHLFVMPGKEGSDEGEVNCHVRIEYTVILTEPKQPSQS